MWIVSCSQFGRFSNNLVNVYLGPHGTLSATHNRRLYNVMNNTLRLREESAKWEKFRAGMFYRFIRGVFVFKATSGGVTLFVDGAKNVNKVGGRIK